MMVLYERILRGMEMAENLPCRGYQPEPVQPDDRHARVITIPEVATASCELNGRAVFATVAL